MKAPQLKTIRELFPRASKSFAAANPHLASPKAPENAVQGNVARSKAKRGAMNKTESSFAMILESQKRKGEIESWQFEGITLRLADNCRFTPDFLVVVSLSPLKIRICEVKGRHIWDDAKVKWRVAKELYHWAEFQLWQRADGRWSQIA